MVAAAALIGAVITMGIRDAIDELVVFAAAGAVFGHSTRQALVHPRREKLVATALPNARARTHGKAVLLMNPKSGGGKVGRFDLTAEARCRGIETMHWLSDGFAGSLLGIGMSFLVFVVLQRARPSKNVV